MADLDTKFKLRETSGPLISMAVAKNVLLSNVFEMADREVEETTNCESRISFDAFLRLTGDR